MPAVTVEDTTTLPRVPVPAPGTVRRRVRSVTTAPSGFEGEGFPVRRAFAGVDLRDLDPFIHMDQMGEVEYAPGEPKGTSWHPHRGFETVTYIIDGTFEHADSHGGGGTISNGDTQWMTAGGGVLHIERPPEHLVLSGGLFHGLQLWVNLPKAQKWVEPRYQDLRADESVLLASPDAGAFLRVIAGDVAGPDRARARPTRRWRWCTPPSPPAPPSTCRGGRTSTRSSTCSPAPARSASTGTPVRTGQLAVFGPGDTITINGARPAGVADAGARRRHPRRRADPRADRHVRAVRHEHPPGGHGRVHRLPGRPARLDPRALRSARRRPGRDWADTGTPDGHRQEDRHEQPRPPPDRPASWAAWRRPRPGRCWTCCPARRCCSARAPASAGCCPPWAGGWSGAWAFVDHYGPDDVAAGAGHAGGAAPAHRPADGVVAARGQVHHRDSLGSDVQFGPGELALMTAGHGIAHAEQSPVEHPRFLHGAQLWVALPDAQPRDRARLRAPRDAAGLDLRRPDDDGAHGLLRRGHLARARRTPRWSASTSTWPPAPTSRSRWSRTSSTGCWPRPGRRPSRAPRSSAARCSTSAPAGGRCG